MHSAVRLNTPYGPSWRAISAGTRHGRADQHAAMRGAIQAAVKTELTAALDAGRYERRDSWLGCRHGTKARTLSGPTGALRSRSAGSRIVAVVCVLADKQKEVAELALCGRETYEVSKARQDGLAGWGLKPRCSASSTATPACGALPHSPQNRPRAIHAD